MVGTPLALAAASRRLVGVAALLGLLAMHGLVTSSGAHCGQLDGRTDVRMVPAAADVGMIATAEVGMHHADDSVRTAAALAGDVLAAHGGEVPGSRTLGLVGLCLAVLLGVVAGLVLAGAVRAVARVAPSANSLRRVPRTARDRDPPSLLALSIQRC